MRSLTNQAAILFVNIIFFAANYRPILRYREKHHRFPNIAFPQRYSERMLWRKLIDHNPQFVTFSDKLATKEYYEATCPELAFPRTLWVGTDADQIPDELLSGSVYVKANHGWRMNYAVQNGVVDRVELKKQADRWLKRVHGRKNFEWAYRMIKPKLFVEESIGDAFNGLLEFNVRASNGKVILGSVIGNNGSPKRWCVYLDRDGLTTQGPSHKEGEVIPDLPDGVDIAEPYSRSVEFTEQLSVGVDYARFDFMWNGTELYGGEITVYPAAGINEFDNPTVHALIIQGWDMLASHFLTANQPAIKRIYANALRRHLKNNF